MQKGANFIIVGTILLIGLNTYNYSSYFSKQLPYKKILLNLNNIEILCEEHVKN